MLPTLSTSAYTYATIDKARGALGVKLPVDKTYYYDALAKLKKVSGAIKRDIEKKYGKGEEEV
jgi:hypothetical protein